MPENGWPIAVPSTCCSMNRPPSTHLLSLVPAVSSGGFDGSIHIFVLTVKDPTNGSSFLCASPGVAAAIQAFIISSWLGMAAGAPAFVAGAAAFVASLGFSSPNAEQGTRRERAVEKIRADVRN